MLHVYINLLYDKYSIYCYTYCFEISYKHQSGNKNIIINSIKGPPHPLENFGTKNEIFIFLKDIWNSTCSMHLT